MTGDIKNTTKLLQYPRVEEFTSVTPEQIISFIDSNNCFHNKYIENLNYYVGRNVAIIKKPNLDPDNPDSRISVSYARTMTQIVKGYMYKPGLITYHSEDEPYLQRLEEIFDENDEPLKTSEDGESQSKYGLGVELLYADRSQENGGTIPFFAVVKPEECVFVFSMDIEPKLIGAIRYYIIAMDEAARVKKYKVEVYFMNRVEIYEMIETDSKKEVGLLLDTYPNFFKDIPFALYPNNQEHLADYEPLKTLIDAYDIMMSDAINETNRFANAYLLLKNFIISNSEDGNEKAQALSRMKSRRVIELLEDGDVSFLTKDIPSEFFDMLKRTLREDIEYHSHIPDFRSRSFEAASGVAMRFSLFDFENLCGDKQAMFEKGLRRRLKLINNFLKIQAVNSAQVNIRFERNLPANKTEIIDNFVKLASTNKIADEDLLKLLPEDIISDLEGALERIKKQKEENMAMMPDLDQEVKEEPMEDDDEG